MNIAKMDSKLREQVWTIAGRVEWTEADWGDFYESLTAVFTRIAARHAKAAIAALPPAPSPEEGAKK